MQTDYKHGEQTISTAIIGMARDFVGSNNMNLLLPLGDKELSMLVLILGCMVTWWSEESE